MKKVLIITTHFAPDRHVGAKRPTQFAKFLPEYGWQPVILTKEEHYYHGVDMTLNKELCHEVSVYRVKEWHIFGARAPGGIASVKNKSATELNRLARKGLLSYITVIMDYVLFYDYSWLIPAFFAAFRILRQQKIALIFSTSPNPEVHLVGLLLKILTGIKWICEFRDPWTTQSKTTYCPTSVVQARVDKYLERTILRKSDHIITVGEILKENLVLLSGNGCRNKSSVIYNGYDADAFAGINSQKQSGNSDKCVISYVGTWGYFISPETFLRGLGSLLKKKEWLGNKIRVNFIGEFKYDPKLKVKVKDIIVEENLGSVINLLPFLSHHEALNYMCQSNILLLVIGIIPEEPEFTKHRLTAKLFEYLYIRKPILALIPPDGECARIIREVNAGEIVSPDNIAEIERKIYQMYLAFETGNLRSNSRIVDIEKFGRRKQTGTLSAIFDSLLSHDSGAVSKK